MKRGRSPISATGCHSPLHARLRGVIVALKSGSVPFMLLASPQAMACDPALEAAVAAQPENTETRDALARSCAHAGRQEETLAEYDRLLARDAGNVDWLLGKSQALVALARPRAALPLLTDARRRAPAYEDVWRLNANVLESLGELAAADALLTEAATQFPQAAWPRERQAALAEDRLLERGTRLSADMSYEDLSGDRSAWRGASLGLDRHLGAARHFFAGLHLEERFDTQDEQLQLAFADRLTEHWSYGLTAEAAPDAEVLPEWSLTAEAGRGLPRAFSLGLRLRHASYTAVDVDTLAGTIEKYASWLRLGYTLNAAKTSGIDDPSYGHLLHFAHDYGTGSRLALVLGFGEEAETVAPGVVQVTDTKSLSIAGLHWTSAAWGLAWEAGWYEQGDLYDRIRVRLGLEHRF
jgi:YaiO family outer membrane protein